MWKYNIHYFYNYFQFTDGGTGAQSGYLVYLRPQTPKAWINHHTQSLPPVFGEKVKGALRKTWVLKPVFQRISNNSVQYENVWFRYALPVILPVTRYVGGWRASELGVSPGLRHSEAWGCKGGRSLSSTQSVFTRWWWGFHVTWSGCEIQIPVSSLATWE